MLIGFLLIMVFYQVLIYFQTNHPSYIAFATVALVLAFEQIMQKGIIHQLFPTHTFFKAYYVTFILIAWSSLWFFFSFIQLGHITKYLRVLSHLFYSVAFVCVLLILDQYPYIASVINLGAGLSVAPIASFFLVIGILMGDSQSIHCAIAASPIIVIGVMALGVIFSFLPAELYSDTMILAGNVAMVIFISVAVNEKYKNDLNKTIKEKTILDESIAASKAVQEALLTQTKLNNADYSVFFKASEHVSGDLYYVREIHNGKNIFVMVGHVTGHGLASGIVAATAYGALESSLRFVESLDLDPESALDEISKSLDKAIRLSEKSKPSIMTMCFACIDIDNKQLHYVNAGHPGIFHYGRNGAKLCQVPGSILGSMPTPSFGKMSIPIEEGDVLVFLTDGVFENTSSDGKSIKPRLFINAFPPQSGPRDIIETVKVLTQEAWGDANVEDDATVVAIQIGKVAKIVDSVA